MSSLGLKLNRNPYAASLTTQLTNTVDTWSPSTADVLSADFSMPDFSLTNADRPQCAFDGCTAGWSKLWKRRARPMFENLWGCSRACIRALVEANVKREMEGADGADVAESHHHRVPLGLVLLAQGLVTQQQLQLALQAQKNAGRGRIGEWLVEAAGVSETKITRGLGMQWQCPVLGLAGFDAKHMAFALPPELRTLCRVAPLRVAGGRVLYLAFDETVDSAAAFALERMSGLKVESGVLPGAEFASAVTMLDQWSTVDCRQFDVADREGLVDRAVDALVKLQPVASKMVRLRDRYWMRLWLERGSVGRNGMLPTTGEDVVDLLLRVHRDSR